MAWVDLKLRKVAKKLLHADSVLWVVVFWLFLQ